MCLKMKEGRDDETPESSVLVFRISSLLRDLHLVMWLKLLHLKLILASVFLLCQTMVPPSFH